MKTSDIFKFNRSSRRINESLEKTFGKKLDLASFDLAQLEDARNKLRTQISQVRGQSGFNENLENEALTQAQWMLDAINSEVAERQEFIADPSPAEVEEGFSSEAEMTLHKIAVEEDEEALIDAMSGLMGNEVRDILDDMKEDLLDSMDPEDVDRLIDDEDKLAELLMDKVVAEYSEGDFDSEGGDTDDAYALASAGHGSDEDYGDFPESKQGEDMKQVTEGEIQQASAIVTAKTMVDRVGRWIEELSGMENDTLLQLGDSIRDEMGSEQAKNFISAVAPAIQQALENLKQTRETLSTGVRQLTGEEQAASMLGAETGEEGDVAPAAPDDMNMPAEEPAAPEGEDEFAAAEPAAGGAEASGREQRESIQFQNRLLKVLAG